MSGAGRIGPSGSQVRACSFAEVLRGDLAEIALEAIDEGAEFYMANLLGAIFQGAIFQLFDDLDLSNSARQAVLVALVTSFQRELIRRAPGQAAAG